MRARPDDGFFPGHPVDEDVQKAAGREADEQDKYSGDGQSLLVRKYAERAALRQPSVRVCLRGGRVS